MRSFKNFAQISFIIIAILAIIGFADSTYLTIKHYQNTDLICNIFNKCDLVTTSSYSKIAGIPVALMGSVYYFILFILAGFFALNSSSEKEKITKIVNEIPGAILAISTIGFMFSIWFTYLQLFVLNALCLYCLISATVTALIFIISIVYKLKLFPQSQIDNVI